MEKQDRSMLGEEDEELEFYDSDPEDEKDDLLYDADPYARRSRHGKADRKGAGFGQAGQREKNTRKNAREKKLQEQMRRERSMRSESWKDESFGSRDHKSRKSRGKRGGGYWIKTVFSMIGCLAVMVGVMYAGTALYLHFQEERNDGNMIPAAGMQDGDETDTSSLTLDENGNVISTVSGSAVYSQEELDARIAEAVLAAQSEGYEEALGTIMAGLSQGDTVLETLRPLYPDHMVIASGGRYHFLPINHELQMNQLSQENLNILESGEFQYLSEGQVISHKGIDVSKHQGEINWSLVAQDGVEFAFIRVGFRGYGSEGKLVEDEYFDQNIQGAQAAGIKTGVYFYSQAITEEEVLEEARLVIEKLAPYTLQCPVVFDVERVSNADGRMNNITVEERTRFAKLFCQTVQDAGYKPMIYHNTEMGALFLDLPELEEYDKWFASYSSQLYYPYAYKIWQYSQSGSVQGVKGAVDLNISFAPLWTE